MKLAAESDLFETRKADLIEQPAAMESAEIGPAQGYANKTSKNAPRNFSAQALAENYHKHAAQDPRACVVITESSACLEALALNDHGVPFDRILAFNFKSEIADIIRENPATPGMRVFGTDIAQAVEMAYMLGLRPVSISIDPTHNASPLLFDILNRNWENLSPADSHDVLWSINVCNAHSKAIKVLDPRFHMGHKHCFALAITMNAWKAAYSCTMDLNVEGIARYAEEGSIGTTFEMGLIRTVRKDSGIKQPAEIRRLNGTELKIGKVKLKKSPKKKTFIMTKSRREHLERAANDRVDIMIDAIDSGTAPKNLMKRFKGMDDDQIIEEMGRISVQWMLMQEADFAKRPNGFVAERMSTLGYFEGVDKRKVAGQLASVTRLINAFETEEFWPAFSMIEQSTKVDG